MIDFRPAGNKARSGTARTAEAVEAIHADLVGLAPESLPDHSNVAKRCVSRGSNGTKVMRC